MRLHVFLFGGIVDVLRALVELLTFLLLPDDRVF